MKVPRSALFKKAVCAVPTIVFSFIGFAVIPVGAQPDETASRKGGEVTIISGREKNTIEARSTRFG